MAIPLLIPAISGGVAYAYGKWFSDSDTPKGTGASVKTVALYALAGAGAFLIYKKVKQT